MSRRGRLPEADDRAEPRRPRPASGRLRKTLTIWWAQWAPADGLQALAEEFGRKENVTVKVHQIPWSSFQDQVFQEFGKPTTAFDIVVGDSQWLGRGATKGLYVDLTSWLPSAADLKGLHPLALKYLAEYPTGSGHYYAAPAETDAMGWAYRKDWFEDPAEKAAFKKKYKRELAVPETWEDLKNVAEFFTRPDKKRYGNVLVTGRGYDDIVMGFEQVLYAFGGAWGDPKTMKVQGALDSADAVKALDFFKALLKYAPPGGSKLGYGEALEPFVNDSSAMLMNYFAFFPDLAKKMGDKVGFFAMPKNGSRRYASLGGQGFSISTKAPPGAAGAGQEVHRLVPPGADPAGMGEEAGRLHRQRRDPEERRLQGGEPVQRRVRRVDGHRAGLLERARLQRADRVHGAAARRGARRQEVIEGCAGRRSPRSTRRS